MCVCVWGGGGGGGGGWGVTKCIGEREFECMGQNVQTNPLV